MPELRTWWMLIIGVVACAPSYAWGPGGHQTVGALAQKLIAGTKAEHEVKALLGKINLQQASVWADCAKAVDGHFKYQGEGQHAECGVFETPAREAALEDFVRRNFDNCEINPGEEICHKQYHYTDVSILQSQYQLGLVGTRGDDVVGAISAAVHVLKGEPAPAPFSFKSKREALLVLVHYVGDIHQPLHVGAIYLNAQGKQVDPDAGTFNPATATRGGNQLKNQGR